MKKDGNTLQNSAAPKSVISKSIISKCVIILDESLPRGLIANTAAILGLTLGKTIPEAIGQNVTDGAAREHLGIIRFPVPVLKGTAEQLRALRDTLYQPEYAELVTVDFSDVAQSCKTYTEYIEKSAQTAEMQYLGLAVCGPKKTVNHLTGSLPLLR